MILFDWRASKFDAEVFRQYLDDSRDILGWWNRLPFAFIVVSRLDSSELSAKMAPFFKKDDYLIVEVNLAESDGSMDRAAWDWILGATEEIKTEQPRRLPPPSS